MTNPALENLLRKRKVTQDFDIATNTREALGTTKPVNPALVNLLKKNNKDSDLYNSVDSYESLLKNEGVRQAAVRFAEDRYGNSNIDEDDAVDEFISHFRSFDVNEMTAAGDYNYVSAAAADSGKSEKAAQRLADYQTLYTAFRNMPAFYEEGGAGGAFSDYALGLATAPTTYIGLLTGGVGKGAGVAATQVAKEAVKKTLMQKLKTPVTTMIQGVQKRPVLSTAIVEGMGGALQNVAAQKTEIAAKLKDEFDPTQTIITAVASGALPAGLALRQAKLKFSDVAKKMLGIY